MEKAYDRVNRKKLFEVMRGYGVQEKLVDVIERIYDGGMVKFEMEGIRTGWCKSDSDVRQGCPLSPLLFKGSNGSWIYKILTNLSKMIFWVILIKNMV